MVNFVEKTVSKKETYDFKLIDFNFYNRKTSFPNVDEDDDTADDMPTFRVQMFGMNEAGETACVIAENFAPYFYVMVPDNWTIAKKEEFLVHLKMKMGNYHQKTLRINDCKMIKRRKLYGFDAEREYRFLRLEFENIMGYNKAVDLWYTSYNDGHKLISGGYRFGGANLKIYESNIPPILRMFHVKNISPSGWIQIPVKKATYRGSKSFTHCDYEFCINYKDIVALPDKDINVPYKCASFDIEANSSHGRFPVPKKGYKLLATNIYDYFYKCGYTRAAVNPKQEFMAVLHHAFGTIKDAEKYGDKIGESVIEPVFLNDGNADITVANVNDWGGKLLRLTGNASRLLQVTNKYNTLDQVFKRFTGGAAAGGGGGTEFDDDAGGTADDDDGGDEEGYTEEFIDNVDDVDPIDPDFIVDTSNEIIKEEELTHFDPATFNGTSGNNISSAVLDLLNEIYAIGTGQSPPQGKDHNSYVNEIDSLLCAICPKVKGDQVVIIGTTLMRYGEKEPYLNHTIVLNTCAEMPNVPNGVVESVATERELLLAWTAFIQRENPDIVYGYNTDGFDYEFLFHRADETDCLEEFLKLGRNRDEICNGTGGRGGGTTNPNTPYRLSETNIKIASGEYAMKYINMIGRMQFDLYMYFRREHTLDSYKLDNVAGHFISDVIKSLVPNTGAKTTTIKTENITGLTVGSYIHIKEISNSAEYYNDGEKFEILSINAATFEVVISGLPTPNTSKILKWGLAKDDITHYDIFRLINGSDTDRAIVAKYCVQDCNLVHYLINKNDIITDYVEMANICSVPISYLVTRGQGIKLFSLLAKFCSKNATLIPVIEKRMDGGYEGAIVLKPKCNLYLNIPVAVNDYNSLYPSAIISENISHDSKVWTREYNLAGDLIHETGEKQPDGSFTYDNLPGYDYVNIQYDTYKWVRNPAKPKAKAKKVLSGYKICRFAQYTDGRKAILPAMLDYLLTQRKNTRVIQKQTKDATYKQTLEMRQLSYKKSANSVYGNCGASTSMFCEKDVAASTTAVGRMNITYAKRIIEEVYGNTKCTSAAATAKWGEPVLTNAEYIYGDSVAAYTPVYLRVRNQPSTFDICTIEEVALKYGSGTWTLCKEPGREDKEVCELTGVDTWSDAGWTPIHRIIRHRLAAHKRMLRVTTRDGSWVDVTSDHSLVLADSTKTVIKPTDVKVGDVLLGSKTPNSGWAFMDTTVKSVELIDYTDDYVYDFTTENHHFSAGVGNIVVHNTDSVFYTFNLKRLDGTPIVGKDALEITIELANEVGQLASSFLKLPHNWEYEKTFMPFCLLSKKRYVGILYEDNPDKGKRKEMGIVLKRRDNAPIVKDIYGGIIDILLKKQDILKAVDFLKTQLQAVADKKVPISKLIITKQLRSSYARPESIAHKVLADRIGDREPGNKPKPGDRMHFAYIHNPRAILQGDKIETPEFIIANKLQLDYAHYITNQIMKPVQQVFALVLERIWELQGKHPKIASYRRELKSIENKVKSEAALISNKVARDEWIEKKLQDKIDDYKNLEVFKLLFEAVLRDLNNRKTGNQSIVGFFSKPAVVVPAVDVPEVAVPAVAVPEVAVPEVAVPAVAVPEVAVPEVAVPEVAVPEPPKKRIVKRRIIIG